MNNPNTLSPEALEVLNSLEGMNEMDVVGESLEALALEVWKAVANGDAVGFFRLTDQILETYEPGWKRRARKGNPYYSQESVISRLPAFAQNTLSEALVYFCDNW